MISEQELQKQLDLSYDRLRHFRKGRKDYNPKHPIIEFGKDWKYSVDDNGNARIYYYASGVKKIKKYLEEFGRKKK